MAYADESTQVVDLIVASLVVDGTPVPRKVARLYLICDILHNSAASIPNAWKFRQEFQSRLGLVFDHLSTIYHSFPGRITADSFKAQILAVVEVWEDWIVFPAEHTSELRARLEGSVDEEQQALEKIEDESGPTENTTPSFVSRFKPSTFKPAEEVDEGPQGVDGDPIPDDVDGDPMENFDGEPMTVDGEPLDDLDGEPMDGLDGEPMGNHESIRDDIDGEPIAE